MQCRPLTYWLAILWLSILSQTANASSDAFEGCFQRAAARYSLDVRLPRAIAVVESKMNPHAINENADGTQDIGIMQINTRWLTTLSQYGITRADLDDPCQNIHVGSWILASNIAHFGATWRAVGAYNAASDHKRQRYVDQVWKAMR